MCFSLWVKYTLNENYKNMSLYKSQKHRRDVELELHRFVTWTLDSHKLLASRPARFTPGQRTPAAIEYIP